MKRCLFAVLLFLAAGVSVLSAEGGPQILTWKDVVQEAKAHNPELASAREQIEQATGSKAMTLSGMLPQISSNFNGGWNKDNAYSGSKYYSYGASVNQLIFDGFKALNDVHGASENIKATLYNYAVVSSNIRMNLRVAFVELMNAQESLTVANDIAIRRKRNRDLVKLNYQSGADNKGSLLTAEADLAQAEFDILEAQRAIELSQRRLVQQMGWEKFSPVIAKENFYAGGADSPKPAFELMVEKIPLLKKLVAQKDEAKFGVKSARSNFFPQIYANAGASRSDVVWPPQSKNYAAGFSVNFPLFEGGLKVAQLKNAKSAFRQAEEEERNGRDSVLFTLASTWTQWQDSLGKLRVQSQYLEASKLRAKITEAEYASGTITFNDWVIIEDNLVNYQQSFLTAQAGVLAAEANWDQARGETLDE